MLMIMMMHLCSAISMHLTLLYGGLMLMRARNKQPRSLQPLKIQMTDNRCPLKNTYTSGGSLPGFVTSLVVLLRSTKSDQVKV